MIASVASLLGGAIGAELLLHTSQTSFLKVVPWLILIGTGTFVASQPISRWLWVHTRKNKSQSSDMRTCQIARSGDSQN